MLCKMEEVIFRPCGRKIAQFATFLRPCGRTKVASVGYFPSTEFLCFFFAHKRPGPFFYINATKNPLLTHKLSILQLNQATFDLPGSAIIRPTHKPSCRSQNSFYKFRKKIILGVNNVRKILGFSRVRVRVRV